MRFSLEVAHTFESYGWSLGLQSSEGLTGLDVQGVHSQGWQLMPAVETHTLVDWTRPPTLSLPL